MSSAAAQNPFRALEQATRPRFRPAPRPRAWSEAGLLENVFRTFNLGTEGSVQGHIPLFSQVGEALFGGIKEEEREQLRQQETATKVAQVVQVFLAVEERVGRTVVLAMV